MNREFMTERKSFVFRFGDVEVCEREFSLIKAGEVLAVEPKAFHVLLFLLRNPQRLVTKEELLDAVWGDAAVTENSLTRSILKLRRLLDDDFREPRYIATVATVGYRLVCKVEILEEASGAESAGDGATGRDGIAPAEAHADGEAGQAAAEPRTGIDIAGAGEGSPAPLPEKRNWAFGWRWVAAAMVVAAGLGVSIWYMRRPLPPLRISEYTQITHDGRHKALFGTDGSRLFLDQYPGSQPLIQVAISGERLGPFRCRCRTHGYAIFHRTGPVSWWFQTMAIEGACGAWERWEDHCATWQTGTLAALRGLRMGSTWHIPHQTATSMWCATMARRRTG